MVDVNRQHRQDMLSRMTDEQLREHIQDCRNERWRRETASHLRPADSSAPIPQEQVAEAWAETWASEPSEPVTDSRRRGEPRLVWWYPDGTWHELGPETLVYPAFPDASVPGLEHASGIEGAL